MLGTAIMSVILIVSFALMFALVRFSERIILRTRVASAGGSPGAMPGDGGKAR